MEHTIECRTKHPTIETEETECDTCLAVGDHTPASICKEIFDEGNGWQTWHYCTECFDAIEFDAIESEE